MELNFVFIFRKKVTQNFHRRLSNTFLATAFGEVDLGPCCRNIFRFVGIEINLQ